MPVYVRRGAPTRRPRVKALWITATYVAECHDVAPSRKQVSRPFPRRVAIPHRSHTRVGRAWGHVCRLMRCECQKTGMQQCSCLSYGYKVYTQCVDATHFGAPSLPPPLLPIIYSLYSFTRSFRLFFKILGIFLSLTCISIECIKCTA